ncbi:MAG: hypothetical protein LBC41_14135 [Clostridiales bacterium]|jgi:hypothetical protein|nr:hypothetical protein [Clostridiales bacterium]MDR2751793.1 hypothetical protein [Clostridiales bacterium]
MSRNKDLIKLVDNEVLSAMVKKIFYQMNPYLNEHTLRLMVGSLADALGYGGTKLVSQATGISPPTITSGRRELNGLLNQSAYAYSKDANAEETVTAPPVDRIRRSGGGRKSSVTSDERIRSALFDLIYPKTYEDPDTHEKRCDLSARQLARELQSKGFQISHTCVGMILKEFGYTTYVKKPTNSK